MKKVNWLIILVALVFVLNILSGCELIRTGSTLPDATGNNPVDQNSENTFSNTSFQVTHYDISGSSMVSFTKMDEGYAAVTSNSGVIFLDNDFSVVSETSYYSPVEALENILPLRLRILHPIFLQARNKPY